MLTCDWCEQRITGKNQTGFSIEAIPFRPLNIAGQRKGADVPVIVFEVHLHERCRESFLRGVTIMLKDHEPTGGELEFDHSGIADAAGREASTNEAEKDRSNERREEWGRLPKHEQDRMALEALGEDRLTNREMIERMEEGDDPCPWFASGDLSIVTRRLFKAGELEREDGQFGKSRFRYSRKEPSEDLKKLGEQLSGGEES